MRVAIVGAAGFGAREHAIFETIRRQNPEVSLYCYPGNARTQENVPLRKVDLIIRDCKERKIDLIIAGPEKDLADGLVDLAKKEGLLVFGPTKEGAQLESDKHFAKIMLRDCAIPTASWRFFSQKDLDLAAEFVKHKGPPVVIKAVGLAEGKGVGVYQHSIDQAEGFLSALSRGGFSNSAEKGVLVEEFLQGKEASLFYLINSDANVAIPLEGAQDHKRLLDQDRGPNTGGMGAFSKAPLLTEEMKNKVTRKIVHPLLEKLRKKKLSYLGVLYVGLMIAHDEPFVVEFNCRFGDPEIQVVFPQMKTSLLELISSVIDGKSLHPAFDATYYMNVVLASGGYPTEYKKGKEIFGLDRIPSHIQVLHASVKEDEGRFFTNGGRVLNVIASGNDLIEARKNVYDFLEKKDLYFDSMHYRKDIGIL